MSSPSSGSSSSSTNTLKQNNIEPNETYETCLATSPPDVPNKIISGLYLSNSKTAAAYLLGRLDDNDAYPRISRMVTIMVDEDGKFGWPSLPRPQGSGEQIQRLVIEKYDAVDEDLLVDFDRTGRFVNDGVLAYNEGKKGQVFRPVVEQLRKMSWGKKPGSKGSERSVKAAAKCPDPTDEAPASSLVTESPSASNTVSVTSVDSVTGAASTSGAVSKPGAVLVHCHAGISRSATIVLAYLLKYHSGKFVASYLSSSQSVEMALAHVRKTRSFVNPNSGFMVQLKVYLDMKCCVTDRKTGKRKEEYFELWNHLDAVEEASGDEVMASGALQ